MTKSKKIFLAFVAAFFLAMLIIAYDISKRTTFPGSKKLLIETLMPSDTVIADTTKMKDESTEIFIDSGGQINQRKSNQKELEDNKP